MSPVEIAPALKFWPWAPIFRSKSNFGSWLVPWLWNGPVRLSEIGPLTFCTPDVVTVRERSSFPLVTFLFPLKVSLRTFCGSWPPPPPQPAMSMTGTARKARMSRDDRIGERTNVFLWLSCRAACNRRSDGWASVPSPRCA